mmetsp:Transcript_12501/g.37873  ORF Transcript_12501/g.37873 Transcript_12501/m.37873 type:complete len:201 (-) Transcript_12501:615-1217(-)
MQLCEIRIGTGGSGLGARGLRERERIRTRRGPIRCSSGSGSRREGTSQRFGLLGLNAHQQTVVHDVVAGEPLCVALQLLEKESALRGTDDQPTAKVQVLEYGVLLLTLLRSGLTTLRRTLQIVALADGGVGRTQVLHHHKVQLIGRLIHLHRVEPIEANQERVALGDHVGVVEEENAQKEVVLLGGQRLENEPHIFSEVQ